MKSIVVFNLLLLSLYSTNAQANVFTRDLDLSKLKYSANGYLSIPLPTSACARKPPIVTGGIILPSSTIEKIICNLLPASERPLIQNAIYKSIQVSYFFDTGSLSSGGVSSSVDLRICNSASICSDWKLRPFFNVCLPVGEFYTIEFRYRYNSSIGGIPIQEGEFPSSWKLKAVTTLILFDNLAC